MRDDHSDKIYTGKYTNTLQCRLIRVLTMVDKTGKEEHQVCHHHDVVVLRLLSQMGWMDECGTVRLPGIIGTG